MSYILINICTIGKYKLEFQSGSVKPEEGKKFVPYLKVDDILIYIKEFG